MSWLLCGYSLQNDVGLASFDWCRVDPCSQPTVTPVTLQVRTGCGHVELQTVALLTAPGMRHVVSYLLHGSCAVTLSALGGHGVLAAWHQPGYMARLCAAINVGPFGPLETGVDCAAATGTGVSSQ